MKKRTDKDLLPAGAVPGGSMAPKYRDRASAILLLLTVSACGGGSGGGGSENSSPMQTINPLPTISGIPTTSVVQDTPYCFIPTADGNPTSFSITNLPSWATFDVSTGALTGTPSAIDLGTFADITIAVTDGQASASLPPIDIEVVPNAPGALTLSWSAPTENVDQSPLTDLAGYRIRWSTQSGACARISVVRNPGLTRYVIDNIVPGEYFVVISAFDDANNESPYSNEASGVVN